MKPANYHTEQRLRTSRFIAPTVIEHRGKERIKMHVIYLDGRNKKNICHNNISLGFGLLNPKAT